jgi:hypothetical protein
MTLVSLCVFRLRSDFDLQTQTDEIIRRFFNTLLTMCGARLNIFPCSQARVDHHGIMLHEAYLTVAGQWSHCGAPGPT